MINLMGRFYFKLTDSRNLIGEFSNNHSTCKRNYTESADLVSRNPEDSKFIGDYFTTWHEVNGRESVLAKLKIEQKPGCENIFRLTCWHVKNGSLPLHPFSTGKVCCVMEY
jgi:hypothetical protein